MPFPARKKIALYAGEIVRGRRRIEAHLRAQEAIKVIRIEYTRVGGIVREAPPMSSANNLLQICESVTMTGWLTTTDENRTLHSLFSCQ